MVLRSSRGRPLNAPAAFIRPCQPIVVVLMNLKAIIAISLAVAVPECAQAQSPSAPTVTKEDAQKVVTIISGHQAKTQTYCDIQNLGEQMERAYEKRNLKLVDELLQKIETLEKTLGPEYVDLIDRLGDIDPENDKLALAARQRQS
jgi:flagellar motility protein MotE (MotC chaperone)